LVQRFVAVTEGSREIELYLKVYPAAGLPGALKDWFRASRALRALKIGTALSREGFGVPQGVAAGERRAMGVVREAFLLTVGIDAAPLPFFLRDRGQSASARRKRESLGRLASEIRSMHRRGFVHGDLVPFNILTRAEAGGHAFFYIDHDRSKRFPAWFPQRLWRRNLVQLNRFCLPGITLQDRFRFLKTYLEIHRWSGRERRFGRWLERKTRARKTISGAENTAETSFRKLMTWNGVF
jgi:hypothetical protein